MPDQPDDPLHYEMKIPPEPKDATLNKEETPRDQGEKSQSGADGAKDDRADRNPKG